MLYKTVFVDQPAITCGQVSKNNPKLINENAEIQIASRLRFSRWSTICPANSAIPKAGTNSISPIIASDKGSLVSEYTCHSITINCMDQPNTSKNRINKNTLNSLYRNAAYGSFFDKISPSELVM